MDDSPKNPYRRARPPRPEPEKRPGLRQLPKDFDDLASGRTDRLPRPRRAPNPLHDEREGAVIPGVRNSEARTVYDARVARLRSQLAAGREADLREGLEEVRSLALWRARNVTDYRAFAESVVGVTPALAEALCASEAPAALPEHAIALAIRTEAALLTRAPGAEVKLRRGESGLRMTMEIGVSDVPRAVEAISDAGRAVVGLRRFLTGEQPGREPEERPGKRRW